MNNNFDSNLLNNSLFDILLVQRIQYYEYNLNEEEIIKKLIKFLILQKNKSIDQTKHIIKTFYNFNPFDITPYEVELILDFINFDYLLDSTLQNSNNYIPIRQSIPHSSIDISNIINEYTQSDIETYINDEMIIPDEITNSILNDSNNNIQDINLEEEIEGIEEEIEGIAEEIEGIAEEIEEIEDYTRNYIADYLFPINNTYNQDENYINSFFQSYPIIYNNIRSILNYNNVNNVIPVIEPDPSSRINTLFNNIINNPLINTDIIENQSANLLYSSNPNQFIRLNYTTRILEIINNVLAEQVVDDEMEDVPIVLRESAYELLEKVKYKDLDETTKLNNKQCTISMEEFTEETLLVKLPCNHYFSDDFAKKWLLENSHKCPLCRESAGENIPLI